MRLLFLLFICLSGRLAAQDFRVQAAAFNKPVDAAYFTDRGVESVVSSVDKNGIYRYFVGTYWTREEAEAVRSQLITKGFAYATVIDLEEQRALYGAKCPYFRDQDIFVERDSVRNIFFETGKSEVDAESRLMLDDLALLLNQKPGATLNLYGFTDNLGDAQTNVALATARTRAVRDYLIAKGVRADRMFIQIFGEAEPGMEHRDFEGNEITENRKWNRRVKLVIVEKKG
ncbi:MAG: OmpA family protein [Saprospiraceae bacterium]|nr:OmpA family protein [Saprospiraceae bacterium]